VWRARTQVLVFHDLVWCIIRYYRRTECCAANPDGASRFDADVDGPGLVGRDDDCVDVENWKQGNQVLESHARYSWWVQRLVQLFLCLLRRTANDGVHTEMLS